MRSSMVYGNPTSSRNSCQDISPINKYPKKNKMIPQLRPNRVHSFLRAALRIFLLTA